MCFLFLGFVLYKGDGLKRRKDFFFPIRMCSLPGGRVNGAKGLLCKCCEPCKIIFACDPREREGGWEGLIMHVHQTQRLGFRVKVQERETRGIMHVHQVRCRV